VSAEHWIAGALLVAGVGVQLAACAGLLVARDTFDRLHLVAPAAVLGAVLICAAVLVNESFSQGGVHALLIAAILLLGSPVLTHATAQAVRLRDTGHVPVLPSEARRAHEREHDA
jgi:multisubunit Na+/H+ antiporter MnhG subunit